MKKSFTWSIVTTATLAVMTVVPLQSVYAAVIHVPADQPTIGKALDAAKEGDTVQVAGGSYVEHISLKSGVVLEGGWNKDYTKRDIKAFETIIDGKGEPGYTVFAVDNGTLDGFTVINGSKKVLSDNTTVGSGVYCNNTSPVISNNTIKNNDPAGVYCNGSKAVIKDNSINTNKEAGVFLEEGSDLVITGNHIFNNNFAGISAGDKPENKPDSKVDIRRNIIHGNGKAGIDAASASGTFYNNLIYKNHDAGIRLMVGPIEFVNNTVVGNSRSGLNVLNPQLVPVIKNNIFADNIEAGLRSALGGYSHNLLFSNNMSGDCNPEYLWCVKNQYGGYEDEEHHLKDKNMIADPLFVDPANDDYHLKGGSFAIDGGDPDKKYSDVHFGPSLGSEINDVGVYGGPECVPEERKGTNTAPEAIVKNEEEDVHVNGRIKLDGRDSKDADGDSITYEWDLVSAPAGSKAKITKKKANRSKVSLKADVAGSYEIGLTVTDRYGLASKKTVTKVTAVDNYAPKASIGEILSAVKNGDTVTLYGTGSSDQDKDPISYKWSIVFKPEGSNASFANASSENASFQVDALGCYAIQLVVNDGKVDSEPAVVYVSTGHKAVGGKRNVPGEYPTIQSAVDAADPGDEIVVQKGVYKENIIVDKNVNLIGVNWPVITGGSKKGNTNTIQFAYLGDTAGKMEGFEITGGGLGGLGHGVNIWDSSPEIFNNKIHDNHHNGVGIHGRGTLTSKTKVHNNLIHDNGLGIGNGLGSSAHIYNNRIFNNHIVGIGCRGLSMPIIDGNYIYKNHLGIGTREVSSPKIINNHVFDNIDGIIIGPVSTIKKFAGDDILIKNNLVYNNGRAGIAITSFNMSKIFVVNNTVDSNNKLERGERGGGLVFGWPADGEFTAIVQNNLITNNIAGMANFTGSELFPAKGATVINDHNNVWNNTTDYDGCKPGTGDISKDPGYVAVTGVSDGSYFLNNSSPSLDAGSKSAKELELDAFVTKDDKTEDQGQVDIGYHYPKEEAKFIEKE